MYPVNRNQLYHNSKDPLGYITSTDITAGVGQNHGRKDFLVNGKPIGNEVTPGVWQEFDIYLLYEIWYR